MPGTLYQYSLLELRESGSPANTQVPGLNLNDALQLQLTVTLKQGNSTVGQADVVLTVNIVAAPALPKLEAAYVLLRWQKVDGRDQVECTRFVWSLAPSRIELVGAQDRRTGVVRQRAVFQWRDSVRPDIAADQRYSIQKITLTDSTHFPGPGV